MDLWPKNGKKLTPDFRPSEIYKQYINRESFYLKNRLR